MVEKYSKIIHFSRNDSN